MSGERVVLVCVIVYLLHATSHSPQSPVGHHIVNMSTYTALASAALMVASGVNGARVRRDDGYGAPEPDTYGAPAETYGAPVESYGASAPSYGAETGLDLTTIIIPLLALLGLFLLFPTYVTLTSVRRKREAVESTGEVNAVERMMDMYQVSGKYFNKFEKYFNKFEKYFNKFEKYLNKIKKYFNKFRTYLRFQFLF